MFRKPKKSKAAGNIRRRTVEREDSSDDEKDRKELQEELRKAKKRAKTNKDDDDDNDVSKDNRKNETNQPIMHQYESQKALRSQKDLVTSTNEIHHPTKTAGSTTNKFLAGPIKATTHIRTTCRFDYQPDICKDYKDTGFCGFGDTCIYLHDRGDTMSGWQLEQQWQKEQELKKKAQEDQISNFMNQHSSSTNGKPNDNQDAISIGDDGIPFACYLCREYFKDPQVTTCGHYFCQDCIMQHVQQNSSMCPVCNKDTHSVFHEPTKLISKKRKIAGRNATWEEYMKACQQKQGNDDDE